MRTAEDMIYKPDKHTEIDPDVADTLYELSNVGVGQASIVLGKMLGETISIGIPKISSLEADIEEIIRDDPEKTAVGILMSLNKTINGAVLFIIDSEFLSNLVNKLIGYKISGDELVTNEESLSAISEVANIMASAYMKAIGKYTGIRIYLSPVMAGVDMIGALISYSVAQFSMNKSKALCVDTSFSLMSNNKAKTAGRVLMFPDDNSVEQIVNAIQSN